MEISCQVENHHVNRSPRTLIKAWLDMIDDQSTETHEKENAAILLEDLFGSVNEARNYLEQF